MTTNPLPTVISRYFAAAEADDIEALVDCFSEDAVVADEERTWRGRTAVRTWRQTVATRYRYTLDVLGATPRGESGGQEHYDVLTHLEGNFPGGAIDLIYEFGLRDGRIAGLQVVPAAR
jgi:ketosteroid isomerase-like protein